ncbi:MAG: hypothetical protein JWN12_450 [Candidatus Saccharibacteria bacterium]|nr:hypothetical protein [Candidatus Saccharibacteria bacterium]
MRTNEEFGTGINRQTPLALRRGIDALIAISKPIKSVSIEGQSNLIEIPQNTPVIVAVSHETGFDIPLSIKALGEHLDLAVTDQSTHHSLRSEPNMFLSLKMSGGENYIPISYGWEDGKKVPGMFDPSDALPMIEAFNHGKSIIVASHNPLTADSEGGIKKPKPGYSAAYLALLTGAPILPVAISMLPTEKMGRFDAIVNIGHSFTLAEQVGIENIQLLSAKRKNGEKLTTDEASELGQQLKGLRGAGQVIFNEVINLEVSQGSFPQYDTKQKMGNAAIKVGNSFVGPIC